MHGHDVFEIELVEFGHDLAQVVLRRWRQVKAAHRV